MLLIKKNKYIITQKALQKKNQVVDVMLLNCFKTVCFTFPRAKI
jgi:hypothetical protein